MKTYRHPETGDKQRVDENDAGAVASLEAQGYVEWGAAEVKQRIQDAAKAVEDAREKLAEAQKEVAARYPGPYAEPDENLMPKPLNPAARVTTDADDELASVTVETKQPSGATDVTSVPRAPAVPKKG